MSQPSIINFKAICSTLIKTLTFEILDRERFLDETGNQGNYIFKCIYICIYITYLFIYLHMYLFIILLVYFPILGISRQNI